MRLVLVDSVCLGGQPIISGASVAGRRRRGRPNRSERRRPGRSRGGRRLQEVETLPSRGESDKPQRRSRRRRRGWSEPTYVSEDVRIQARAGRRAAIVPVREGLWLVGDIDEAALQEFRQPKDAENEVGFVPLLLGPLLVKAATSALAPGGGERGDAGVDLSAITKLFGRRRRRQPEIIDAEFEDVSDDLDFGCNGRRCRRSR